MAENKIEVDVVLAIEKAQKDVDALNKQFTAFGQNLTKQVGQMDSTFATFKGTLGALGIARIFDAGVAAVKQFAHTLLVESVKAAQESENAVNELNQALGATGIYTQKASEDFQNFASEIQKATKFQDDAVISAGALIQTLGRLDEEGLKRATKAAVDMAAALSSKGVSLTSAADLVGKAAAGNTAALSRYGIVIEEGGTKAERFAKALAQIEEKFGGRAAAQVQNYTGALAQAANQFNDLQERIGGLITKNPVLVLAIKATSDAFVALTGFLDRNKASMNLLVSQSVIKAVDGFALLLDVLDGTVRFFTALGLVVKIVASQFVTVFLAALTAVLNTLYTLGQAMTLLGMKNPFEDIARAANDELGQAIRDIGTDTEALGEQFSEKGLLGHVADYVGKSKVLLEQHATDAQLADQKVVNSAKAANEQILLQAEARRLSFFESLTIDVAFFQQTVELERLKTQVTREEGEKRVEIERKIVDSENKLQALRAANFKSTLNVIAGLQKSSSRELFYIGKAAALAGAIIDGYAAVQKAFNATANYYVNVGLAVLTAAAVAVQVSGIASQGPGFATGGIVPGSSLAGDNVPIQANSREAILTLDQQTSLYNFISGLGNRGQGGQGGGGVVVQVEGNLYLDSPARVDEFIEKINDRVRFAGVPLFATGTV